MFLIQQPPIQTIKHKPLTSVHNLKYYSRNINHLRNPNKAAKICKIFLKFLIFLTQ